MDRNLAKIKEGERLLTGQMLSGIGGGRELGGSQMLILWNLSRCLLAHVLTPPILAGSHACHPHFAEEDAKAQRTEQILPRRNSWVMAEQKHKPGSPVPEPAF